MGVVYAAHDRELDRQVALKVMRGAAEGDEDRLRMLREGQAMARVTHPNVIIVFEVGTDGGTAFLAQELLDGGTLRQWLEQPRSHAEIIDKFVAAGRGLAAAHAAGLVHRDFKPDNVLLGRDGRVRVADFGLARAVASPHEALAGPTIRGGGRTASTTDTSRSAMTQLTRTGAVMGTPMFMAPEQHEGNRADARSDQFAFCVALYHALYGDWPFDGKSAVALADNVIHGVMKPPPRGAGVPPRVRDILLRGLRTKPEHRYPSMEALLAELAANPRARGITVGLALAAGSLLVGAAAIAYVLMPRGSSSGPAPSDAPRPPVTSPTRDFDPAELARALDHGMLDPGKFDDAAALMREPARRSVARSAASLVHALRGDLPAARAKADVAAADGGPDRRAQGYVELANAAIAFARGELEDATARSTKCASLLGVPDSVAVAMCRQLEGDAAAERGMTQAARAAYDQGLAVVKPSDVERVSSIRLAIAQLEFDDKREDMTLDEVIKVQKEARRRGAVSTEASAAVLAARMQLEKSEQLAALDVFEDIEPSSLQSFRLRIMAQLALGEIHGFRNEAGDDGLTGLDRIEQAKALAAKRGFVGLELEARLARVRVLVTTSDPAAETERRALVTDATKRGFDRIARLAERYGVAP